MKMLTLLFKLISKNPFMFVMIVFQTAVVATAFIAINNAYGMTHNCMNSIDNENRIIYRMSSSLYYDGSIGNTAYQKETDELFADNPYYKGTSFITDGSTYSGENATLALRRKYMTGGEPTEEEIAQCKYEDVINTYYYNTLTLESITYPLQSGEWNLSKKIDGYIPCAIGGTNADNYQLGEKLEYFTMNSNYDEVIPITYIVTAILSEPLYLVSANSGRTDVMSNGLLVSELFKTITNEPLVLVANSDLVKDYDAMFIGIRNNYLVYFDSAISDEELEHCAVLLEDAYACTDKQMIKAEQLEITGMVDVIYPFVIMLFVVSLSAIISMSVITILKNQETQSIYFILGCPRWKMMLCNCLYSVLYIGFSALLTQVIINIAHYFIHDFFKHLFSSSFEAMLPIYAIFVLTAVISIIVPYFILKKHTIKEMMLKTSA